MKTKIKSELIRSKKIEIIKADNKIKNKKTQLLY
jgi:hypothetical protein